MARRNPGRPKLDKVRIHVSISPAARDAVFDMAIRRGVGAGILLEELIWQENERLREPRVNSTRRL